MIVSELIVQLKMMPQDAPVEFSENEGCVECNAEHTVMYHEIRSITLEGGAVLCPDWGLSHSELSGMSIHIVVIA